MFTRNHEGKLHISQQIFKKYDLGNIAFFDIETTGFNRTCDIIMLISIGYFKDYENFIIKQYYAEYIEDEENVLKAFKEEIAKFDSWCSYNGIAFDEDFIIKRMERNNIEFVPPSKHVDLYRLIKPYHKQFGLERCNLKTIERFLGIDREDRIDGGLSVQLYKQYLYTNNDDIRDTIMLHNYEDVLNLPLLFNLIYRIGTDPNIKKEPGITPNQLKYLNILLKKNNIEIESDIKSISKKAASRAIDSILKGNVDNKKIDFIIKDTY
ncbi:hypothetical protein CLTEP_07420 [Clostridium tepidiprofundi DSM 19306]|uniref:YprB ribonuclease H-like domain-containing protein n=1 Tax=Clostridium tepidiprofundi DSM 19306 TaxID=1121338 RepID=A0A151B5Y4_9CLOT|nr:ribonuclease H-like domain-containing protein [Clostridium tepidiprofundi]KYH35338.1 hypothetical protein CLTEP_07420 [Clostridium tepidiprofundi DSM 19306]